MEFLFFVTENRFFPNVSPCGFVRGKRALFPLTGGGGGGSGIKKRGGVAMTHRCILRCLTQLGFEALPVATTQSIALKTGPSFSLRGLPCE